MQGKKRKTAPQAASTRVRMPPGNARFTDAPEQDHRKRYIELHHRQPVQVSKRPAGAQMKAKNVPESGLQERWEGGERHAWPPERP